MHFRIRGNNVQIVKTVPGEAGRKVQSKPIGSANINTGEISERAKAALSAAEMEEVKTWIANHKATAGKRGELEFATLPERLREVAVWARGASAATLAPQTDSILESIRTLRSVLLRKNPKAKAE
jgi:hypothetical protein